MNFLLTTYIYPLEEKIILSNNLGITLDNLRTQAEIEYVARYLKVSLNSPDPMYGYGYTSRLPVNAPKEYLSIKLALKEFYKKHKNNNYYLRNFYKDNPQKDVFEFLAKMWVVARFDDEGAFEKLAAENEEMRKSGDNWVGFLTGEHPIYKNSERLVDYAHILSMILRPNEDEYSYDVTILLHTSIDTLRTPKIDNKLNTALLYWAFSRLPTSKENKYNWRLFENAEEDIQEKSKNLERILDDRSINKVLYIGSLLKISSEADVKIKLILLVTIIEMILTRNPDTSRFNIEDSISKQFKLKAGILIYLNNRNRDLNEIKKRLSEIYSQRSNIAHGNLVAFDAFLNKKAKEYKDDPTIFTAKELILDETIINLFDYVKAILEEYILDRDFVEYIKEN